MTRRVDFDEWQRVRRSITSTQTRILAREEDRSGGEHDGRTAGSDPSAESHATPPAKTNRPTEGRPLHSHRPRSDDEWAAVADGVRILLAERTGSGRWTWHGTRKVVIRF